MRNKLGRFEGNNSFKKICIECKNTFIAASGARKWCSNCCKCKNCFDQLKNGSHDYCSIKCSSIWNHKNNPKVRTLHVNRFNAYLSQNVEKRVKKVKGKPNFNMRGEKNPNWKGGTYGTERHTLMGRIEYINWRKQVFERDNYTCQFCGIRGGKLNADHIIPYAADKTKALDLNNGRTLCIPCHKKTDTWGHKVHKYIENKYYK